jgi:NHL repeat.
MADTVFQNAGSGPAQLFHPNDISISENGDIYIADMDNNRIQVFDSSMNYKRQIGTGVLSKPARVSVDEHDNVFVMSSDSAIFVFDSSGTLIDTIVVPFDQHFVNVFDLEARDNSIYITNEITALILGYDGSHKKSWNYDGRSTDGYLVTGNSNKIFVSLGRFNGFEVRVFDTLGNTISRYETSGEPTSIAFNDKKKLLYVICYGEDNKLHVIDENNMEIANYRTKSKEFNVSMALQKDGTVLLVFREDSRIIRLKPSFW